MTTPLIYSGPPIYGPPHQQPLLYTVVPLYTDPLTSDHPSYIQWSPYIWPPSPVATPLIYSGPPIYGPPHLWPPLLYTVVPLYTPPSPVATPLIYSGPPIYGPPHQQPPLSYTVVPLYTAPLTSDHLSYIQWSPYIRPPSPVTTPLKYRGSPFLPMYPPPSSCAEWVGEVPGVDQKALSQTQSVGRPLLYTR